MFGENFEIFVGNFEFQKIKGSAEFEMGILSSRRSKDLRNLKFLTKIQSWTKILKIFGENFEF